MMDVKEVEKLNESFLHNNNKQQLYESIMTAIEKGLRKNNFKDF